MAGYSEVAPNDGTHEEVVSVHKNAKRDRGQYPAILTSRLVNNIVNNIYLLYSRVSQGLGTTEFTNLIG